LFLHDALPIFKGIGVGAFVVLAEAVAIAMTALQGIIMVIADVAIAIKTAVVAIGDFGKAADDAFHLKFGQAAKDAHAGAKEIGEGVKDIGKNFDNLKKNNALSSVNKSLKDLGKSSDETKSKSKSMSTSVQDDYKAMQNSAQSTTKSLQNVGNEMTKVFNTGPMQQYAQNSLNISKSYSQKQEQIAREAGKLILNARNQSATQQRQAQIKADNLMLQDQSQSNNQMLDIMKQNSEMLKNNKTKEGQQLN